MAGPSYHPSMLSLRLLRPFLFLAMGSLLSALAGAGEAAPPLTFRLHDGTEARSSELPSEPLRVTTSYGTLAVPWTELSAVSLSRVRKAEVDSMEKLVTDLVAQLSDDNWKRREKAQQKLEEMGASALPFLKPHREDADPERRERIHHILDVLEEQGAGLGPGDSVSGPGFCFLGWVEAVEFPVHTLTGVKFSVRDIEAIQRDGPAPKPPAEDAVYVQLKDGTSFRTLWRGELVLQTSKGLVRIPAEELEHLAFEKDRLVARTKSGAVEGTCQDPLKLETRYGVLNVLPSSLAALSRGSGPPVGTILPGGDRVVAAQAFRGHTYVAVYNPKGVPWESAMALAQRMGGHLATVSDKTENDFIGALWEAEEKANPQPRGFWIGFTDAGKEGDWQWVTGEPVTFTAWDKPTGQPDNYRDPVSGKDEDCAEFWLAFQNSKNSWNDYNEPSPSEGIRRCVVEIDGLLAKPGVGIPKKP